MTTMNMGYYYDLPKRGLGYNVSVGPLYFSSVAGTSLQSLKRQLQLDGHINIKVEKNEN